MNPILIITATVALNQSNRFIILPTRKTDFLTHKKMRKTDPITINRMSDVGFRISDFGLAK